MSRLDLFDLYAKISLDDSEYNEKIDSASTKTSGFADKLKSGLATAAKVGVAAIAAAATGIVALTKSSIENYAEYEQLVGGVETLFKDSSDTVVEYANNAYKTAGLSANDYMATVTSFSASLLQSLGGDTAAAADMADMAITDMSDNANKMGTDMEAIQNAYNGFAKQNYTMLDNLKLGYGGTKEEMERLIADAEKLAGLDLDISSYADIVTAIHAVQTELGITGTTAQEASTTIQGSISSMKAAWTNFLTGMADDTQGFDTLVGNLVDSVITVGNNLIPRIQTLLPRLTDGITQLVKNLISYVPGIVETLLPAVVDGTMGIINGIVAVLPELISSVLAAISQLVNAVIENLPAIASAAIAILITIISSLADAFPALIPQIVDAVMTIVTLLLDNMDAVIEAVLSLIQGIADGIIASLPILAPAIVEIVLMLVEALVNNIPVIQKAAIQLMTGMVEAIIQSAPLIWDGIEQVVEEAKTKITSGDWASAGRQIISDLWAGVQEVWGGFTAWFSEVWSGLISNIQMPDWLSKALGTSGDAGVDGSHANGLNYVPYDGYIAELHTGERVLTADEAADYRRGARGVSIVQNIYAERMTPAQAFAESLRTQERAVFLGA